MSFFAKAVVHALKEVPGHQRADRRRSHRPEPLLRHRRRGLDRQGPDGPGHARLRHARHGGIEQAIADVAKKARDGKITLADLEGGVFTITNGGIFGSMLSTPILNRRRARSSACTPSTTARWPSTARW
jgi:2-oxoglutarate dehydrogenase E2 component (dihydrolipoamide succinyltransferase)